MAYPLRLFEPGRVFFVTNRCIQSRLLLRPSPEINREIGAVLARATNIFAVDLYAFTFASNHFHLVARMRDANSLSDFVAYLEANVARRVGRIVDWQGRFWHRRFSAEPILDNEALVGRLLYTALHGAKEGLVAKCEQWPGLTCLPELLHGVVRSFDWLDRTAHNEAVRRGEQVMPSNFTTRYTLRLATPPCWEHLENDQRFNLARQLVLDAEQQIHLERGDKPVLGVDAILAQHPHSVPEQTSKSPRPLCHAVSNELRNAYRATHRAFVDAYRTASELLRNGRAAVEFPPHAFMPPLPWRWRLHSEAAAT